MGILKKLCRKISGSKTDTINDHERRYLFEYQTLPYYAAFQSMLFFMPDYEGNEFMHIVAPDEIDTEWGREYFKSVSMKIYALEGGQVTVVQFPDPQGSPELKYAAVFVPQSVLLSMKSLDEINNRTFYIMSRVGNDWYAGDIRAVSVGKDTEYLTTYHQRMPESDLEGFIQWVMNREGVLGDIGNSYN